jgi:predicted AAA+ superfamily ATPase
MKRAQTDLILKDLPRKMVFIVGPRQAGKTYLAKQIAKEFNSSVYLNFDQTEDRKIIEEQKWLEDTDLLIFDELHKMPEWKNYLKGLYDTKPKKLKILVTGSARLDIVKHLGDSLAGRYFLHRLLPFSFAELHQCRHPTDIDSLMKRSGFPEPFLAESDTEANRWRLQYINSLLTTDVFDIEKIQNIRTLQTVFEILRTKVGSPLSYQSIAEDVSISPNTVKKYIQTLEALYIIFLVRPYSKNIARSLLKEPKIYFFDTGLIKGDDGIKFENLMALSLLKHCYAKSDYEGEVYQLHYLRTKEQKEVDFALVHDMKIEQIIEAKLQDKILSKPLSYFHEEYNLSAVQVVKELRQERKEGKILIRKAELFLKNLIL